MNTQNSALLKFMTEMKVWEECGYLPKMITLNENTKHLVDYIHENVEWCKDNIFRVDSLTYDKVQYTNVIGIITDNLILFFHSKL